jgi:hypothetical protein
MLSKLTELTFENNPVEKESNILNILKEKFPSLNSGSLSRFVSNVTATKNEAFSKVSIMKNGSDGSMKNCNTLAKKKALENTVIKIIQKEWEKEMERRMDNLLRIQLQKWVTRVLCRVDTLK